MNAQEKLNYLKLGGEYNLLIQWILKLENNIEYLKNEIQVLRDETHG